MSGANFSEINEALLLHCADVAVKFSDGSIEDRHHAFLTQLLCEIEAFDADMADRIGAVLGDDIWQPSPRLAAG